MGRQRAWPLCAAKALVRRKNGVQEQDERQEKRKQRQEQLIHLHVFEP